MTPRPTPAEWARMNWYQRDRWQKRMLAALKAERPQPREEPDPEADAITRAALRAIIEALDDGPSDHDIANLDPPGDPRDWPAALLRKAHAANYRHIEAPWITAGEREYQRRRGVRRRAAGNQARRERSAALDARIVQLIDSGLSYRQTAARIGLDRWTISRRYRAAIARQEAAA